jgi:hypothetical protein
MEKPEKNASPKKRTGKILVAVTIFLMVAGASVYALALLLTRTDVPERLTSLAPVHDDVVEDLFRRLAMENGWDTQFSVIFSEATPPSQGEAAGTEAPAIGPVGSATPTTVTLTEDALNGEFIYLFREHPPRLKGLRQFYVRVEPGRLTLLGVVDGRELLSHMPPDQQHLLPTLLRREGVLQVRLKARKDLIGRTWLRIDSTSFGHLPIPNSVISPLLETCLHESTYDAEDGFFVSRRLESLTFDQGFITLKFKS